MTVVVAGDSSRSTRDAAGAARTVGAKSAMATLVNCMLVGWLVVVVVLFSCVVYIGAVYVLS